MERMRSRRSRSNGPGRIRPLARERQSKRAKRGMGIDVVRISNRLTGTVRPTSVKARMGCRSRFDG